MINQLQIDNDGIMGETIRRNLHFIWLVDDSGSMSGNKIQALNYAVKNVLPELRKIEDDNKVNILMRAIKFGSRAEWHVGPAPTSAKSFNWVDMNGQGGGTATAQAIELLCQELDVEKIGGRNVPPVIILLSDGYCTDPNEEYNQAIARLDSLAWGKKAVRISIGIGQDGDYNKEQLDSFITPYLRTESKLETLQADNVRKLIEYIKTVSTQATISSSDTKSNTGNNNQAPVQIDAALLEVDSYPAVSSYEDLDANDVF